MALADCGSQVNTGEPFGTTRSWPADAGEVRAAKRKIAGYRWSASS